MILRKKNWRSSVKTFFVSACAAVAVLGANLCDSARAQSSGEMKPLAVVALSGYDSLVEDINFLGSLAGQPQIASMYEPMIMGFTQGLDKTKPIGVIVQSDGVSFGGAACLPVTDLEKLLMPLQAFGVMPEKQDNGTWKIVTPDKTIFAREAAGWVFLAPMEQFLESLPAAPDALLAEISNEYDLGARVHVQNIPEAYRQMAIQQLEMGMKAGLRKLPNESDAQFESRKELTGMQIEQIKRAISELDQATIGLALDSEQQRTYLDFAYTAVPDTKLAEQLTLNKDPKTNFAGFFQPDAAMMMTFASKVGESDIAQVNQMFDTVRKQVMTAIEEEGDLPSEKAREVAKSAVDDFLDAFQATLQAGVMDGGAVLNLAPNSMTLVAGGFVGEPAKVESGLKKLVELAKEEKDFPGIAWNSDNHGDVSFHTISVPVPANEEEPRKLFGDTMEIVVGIGKQSVYFALGRDCISAVKGVIDASAAEPQKSVPPMEMSLSLQQIMNTAVEFAEGEEEKATIRSIAAMLASDDTGRDHVRIVVQPIPNGVRSRVELEEGVLRAIGAAAMQAKMQAAGAGGF